MRTQIIATRNGFRIKMTDLRRRRIEALGAIAGEHLKYQNGLKWATSSDSAFLPLLKRGVAVLKVMDLYGILDLSEPEAHCAFMACRFMALRNDQLSARERRSLQQVLLVMARCCLIEIEPVSMPTVEQAVRDVHLSPGLSAAYHDLCQGQPISLALGSQLWTAFNAAKPRYQNLLQELGKATLGFRTSLLWLQRRGTEKRAL
jgi:hypothetical protein